MAGRINSLNERNPRATTWHVESVELSLIGESTSPSSHTTHNMSLGFGALDSVRSEPMNAALREGMQLVAKAAHRVWEELYVCKKPVSYLFAIDFIEMLDIAACISLFEFNIEHLTLFSQYSRM